MNGIENRPPPKNLKLMPKRIATTRALTFMELLVTVTILATGMVMIYKAMLLSLDYQDYLTQRLYGANLLENKIAVIQRDFQYEKTMSFSSKGEFQGAVLNNKRMAYQFSYVLSNIGTLKNLFQLDVILSWMDHGRSFSLTKSIYISQL